MMNFDINWYVEKYIPIFMRKTKFLQFLIALAKPLLSIWYHFSSSRIDMVYRTNLTSQRLAMQEHLNNVFDSQQRRIIILHYSDAGLYFPLSTDGYSGIGISLESEDEGVFIAMEGEVTEELGVSFLILIPTGVNSESLKAEVDKYKLAGKTFEITIT